MFISFGHDEWETLAPGLKTMADAVHLRERMLLAFEVAAGNGPRLEHRTGSPPSSLEEVPQESS